MTHIITQRNAQVKSIYYGMAVLNDFNDGYASLMGEKDWRARAKSFMRTEKITQDEVATSMGLSQGAIAHWLAGRRKITLTDFFKFSKALGCKPEWLLFGIHGSFDENAKKEFLETMDRLLTIDPTKNPNHQKLIKKIVSTPKTKYNRRSTDKK